MGYFWEDLTDMTEINAALNEMSKKYKDTVLGVFDKQTGENYYAQLGEVNTQYVGLYTATKDKKVLVTNRDVEMFVPKVSTGCYTSVKAKGLVVLSYLPHRQWKKGLCKQNTEIAQVLNYYRPYSLVTNDFNQVIFEILDNVGLQNNRTLDKAFKFLDENDFHGVSLNRNFGITVNFNDTDTNKYFLFHERYVIGYILRKEKQIVIENDIFLQEVLDTQHDWCSDYKVKVE